MAWAARASCFRLSCHGLSGPANGCRPICLSRSFTTALWTLNEYPSKGCEPRSAAGLPRMQPMFATVPWLAYRWALHQGTEFACGPRHTYSCKFGSVRHPDAAFCQAVAKRLHRAVF